MTLKGIQQEVDAWTSQYTPQYWKPHEILARLMEETGELAREINHRYGPKKKKSTEEIRELEDELGDILFTLCCLANSLHIDLDASFDRMMEKTKARDSQRFVKKI